MRVSATTYSQLETLYFLGDNIPGGTASIYNVLDEKLGGSFGVSEAVIDLALQIERLQKEEWTEEREGYFFEDMIHGGPWLLNYVEEHRELPTAQQFATFVRACSQKENEHE